MKYSHLFLLLLLIPLLIGATKKKEIDYQKEWCEQRKGQMEVSMRNGTRCDCLTTNYAVEFDFASKWLEAVGQSLNYAHQSGRQAGIVLICRSRKDVDKLGFLRDLIISYSLPIKVWSMGCIL